jgi:hypothetical protein
MEFSYDGGGIGKGGTVTLYLDGEKAGEGRVEQTEPLSSPPTRRATLVTNLAHRSPTTIRLPRSSMGR